MMQVVPNALPVPFPPSLHSTDDIEKLTGSAHANRLLRIVCVGAHPDDPESGCGGTLAKLASLGHHVSIIYLTRGEAGIKGGERNRTATIRTGEALRACQVLGGKPLFSNQVDGETAVDRERYEHFSEMLAGSEPDLVFTHWPIDTHRDHRTVALLTYQAWQSKAETFALAYYEVMTGVQTHHFQPNCFINISGTWQQKREAIYAHGSQSPDRFYPYHAEMELRRGSESSYERAEAFVVLREKEPKPYLPFTL